MKVLAFAGSVRKGSFNKMAVREAMKIAQDIGIDVTFIDLKDYVLPIYDGDLESEKGIPDNAEKLKILFKNHDVFLISSPEYNSSVTPVLKNTIDWISRPVEGEVSMEPFVNKTALLMSASPGNLGGLRGQYALRYILQNIGVLVLPDFITIGRAHETLPNLDEKAKAKLRLALTKLKKSFF